VRRVRSETLVPLSRILPKVALWLLLLPTSWAPDAAAFELVTQQEASLPDDLSGAIRGGPTRGPDILVKSPATTGSMVRSPVTLSIKFQAHGGSGIDRESIIVTYKKLPPVDITQRITAYIQNNGIAIEDAELPPGTHRFQIEVSDRDGRKMTEFLTINIERPPRR
jgi:hypothetical protein